MERAWSLNKEANHQDRQSSTQACPQLPHLVSSAGGSLAGGLAGKLGALFSSSLPHSLVRPSNRITLPPPLFWPHLNSALLSLQTHSKANLMSALGGEASKYRQNQQVSVRNMTEDGQKQEYRADIIRACPSGQSKDDLCVWDSRSRSRAARRRRWRLRGCSGAPSLPSSLPPPSLLSLAHSNRAPRGQTPVAQREKESI